MTVPFRSLRRVVAVVSAGAVAAAAFVVAVPTVAAQTAPTTPSARRPSWLPAPGGYFRDMPGNLPNDTVPPQYAGRAGDPWYQYSTSAVYLRDVNAVVLRGSGHMPNGTNMQGTAYQQLDDDPAKIGWSWRNATDRANPDEATNDYEVARRGWQLDGSAPNGHPYGGLAERPVALGGAPDLLQLESITLVVWSLDVTKPKYGYRAFSNNRPAGEVGAGPFDATPPYAGRVALNVGNHANGVQLVLADALHGWFAADSNGDLGATVFVDREGKVHADWPEVLGGYTSGVLLWDDANRLLLGLKGREDHQPYETFFLSILDTATRRTTRVHIVGPRPLSWDGKQVETGGARWIPDCDCALVPDVGNPSHAASLRFIAIRPPATGDRRTGDWTSSYVDLKPDPAAPATSAKTLRFTDTTANSMVRFVWIPRYRAGILYSQVGKPAQVFTLP